MTTSSATASLSVPWGLRRGISAGQDGSRSTTAPGGADPSNGRPV